MSSALDLLGISITNINPKIELALTNLMKRFLDKHALWMAMVIGVVGYPLFRHLMFLLPPMIFFMLFFTFCKVNPLDLRLHR